MLKIHEKIRQRRKQLNMSIADLASNTGLSQGTLYRIEQGRAVTIPELTMLKICRCLQLTPEQMEQDWGESVPSSSVVPLSYKIPYDFKWATPLVHAYMHADPAVQKALCRALEIPFVEPREILVDVPIPAQPFGESKKSSRNEKNEL